MMQTFGPLFLKICGYAPWSMKLCLNGREWAKRQLEKKKIAYEALDNGFLSCAEPGETAADLRQFGAGGH
jgi:hypothetical protein